MKCEVRHIYREKNSQESRKIVDDEDECFFFAAVASYSYEVYKFWMTEGANEEKGEKEVITLMTAWKRKKRSERRIRRERKKRRRRRLDVFLPPSEQRKMEGARARKRPKNAYFEGTARRDAFILLLYFFTPEGKKRFTKNGETDDL